MGTSDFNPSYILERPEVLGMVPMEARSILDVGCSIGTLGRALKDRQPARVVGIELSPEMGREAAGHLDEVLIGDIGELIAAGRLAGRRFDTLIFADVLEHLSDPWSVLGELVALLEPGGWVITSLPNIRHLDTIINLVIRGYWPYRDRGIHDRTHLRYFTRRNILELYRQAGLEIEAMRTVYRIIERPHRLNRFAKFLAFPPLRPFLAFQYLTRGRKPVVSPAAGH